MDRKRDAQNDVVFRGTPQSRSGGLIQDASRLVTLADLYELRSGVPKPRESERRFLTGAYCEYQRPRARRS